LPQTREFRPSCLISPGIPGCRFENGMMLPAWTLAFPMDRCQVSLRFCSAI
jgi:hypothetical protein